MNPQDQKTIDSELLQAYAEMGRAMVHHGARNFRHALGILECTQIRLKKVNSLYHADRVLTEKRGELWQ